MPLCHKAGLWIGFLLLMVEKNQRIWSHQAEASSQQGRAGAWRWGCAVRPAPAGPAPQPCTPRCCRGLWRAVLATVATTLHFYKSLTFGEKRHQITLHPSFSPPAHL